MFEVMSFESGGESGRVCKCVCVVACVCICVCMCMCICMWRGERGMSNDVRMRVV